MVGPNSTPDSGKEPLEFEGLRRGGAKERYRLENLPGWAKWIALGAAALLVISIAVWAIGGMGKKAEPTNPTAGNGSKVESETARPESGEESAEWVAATLADGATVYGEISDVGIEGFVGLKNAYFVASVADAESETEKNVLRRYGGEPHAPQPFLVVPVSSLTYREPLTASSEALKVIQANETAQPSGVKDVVFGEERMSALFLLNGEVFFGKLTVDGDTLVLKDAYFLRFKDEKAAELGKIESLDQVVLVPRAATPSSPTGDMYVPTSSALYIQTLAADSPVISAIEAAE